jgi:phospholipase C
MAITARRPRRAANCLAVLASSAFACVISSQAGADPDKSVDRIPTASPIKHVIIIVGENRSFDHLFATYVAKNPD